MGPGPSCELAGRVPIAGKKGRNQVHFDGTVRRVQRETVGDVTLETVRQVPLEPGTYLLELTSRAGKRKLARTFVTIVDPDLPRKRYVRPQCSSGGLAARTPVGVAPPIADMLAATAQSVSAGKNSAAGEREDSEVLGDRSPEAGGAPIPAPIETTDGRSLEIVLLMLAIVLALVAAVVRSVRRKRTLA